MNFVTWQRQQAALRSAEGKSYEPQKFEAPSAYPTLYLGTNLLFEFFKEFVASDPALVPPKPGMMHYPWLLAGYFAPP